MFYCAFSLWLAENIQTANERMKALAPVIEHIAVLREQLVSEVGFRDVRWENKWGLVQFRASLLGLIRLCAYHSTELLCLKGKNKCRHEIFPEFRIFKVLIF